MSREEPTGSGRRPASDAVAHLSQRRHAKLAEGFYLNRGERFELTQGQQA